MSSDLQPLYSLLEEVQRQKNAILCSRPVRPDPADFHRYLDHLTAHGPELGDPARLVDQCIRQAETGVQELVQSLFEEEQQHWYRAERLLSHRAERPLSPAAPAPTSAPSRAPVRAPATTAAVPAASRAGRARPPQLATERRAQQRRERQRPPPPPPRAAPPRAAARGAAPPAAPRGHPPQREPPAAVGAGGAAPTAAVPLSRPRHLEDTARAALFPPAGGGEPPAPPPPPPPPQPQPPAPRAPPLLAYEEFQSARRPRRVVAPPADSVRLVHLGLDESSDGSDLEPLPVGPEDALSRGVEPQSALEEGEPQQETGGTEGGASGPPRPPTSVGADSEPPTPRPAESEETAGQDGQGGGEEEGARLAAGADTDGAGPPNRQSGGRAIDVGGSSGGRRGARSTPAAGDRSGGDRRRTDRAAAAGVRRTPSAGGDARRSPGREPSVLRPAPSVGGPGVRWRDGPPAVPATGGHRPRARSDVRADVTWVPMDTGVFSSAGRQRTSGETKRKLEINAYKLIQEVVAASMAGCGDSSGSSRSDDVTGSSESVRQTARSPAAVAADALAAELDRAVADHRLPTAQFSSCSSRSGGPSPSEEDQAAGGPTGVTAAAERAGVGQTPQRQPQLQEKQPPPPPQQQQGRQLRQCQQEPQEQERQHQQQHQQHLLHQLHQQPQQHQQHQHDYQQHQQNQHPQHQHQQQANRPREDGDRTGQRQSSPPSPPPKPPRALPAAESRSDPAETVSEATGPPSEVSPSVALPSLSRSAPPSEGRSAAAVPVDSDPDPDLERLQRQAPVGGSGEHSAAETDDQVSDTALESDSAGLLPGGDSDSPAEGERHAESNGRPQVTPGTAVYQRTVTEPPSAGGCLTALPSAGGCLTAPPSAGDCLIALPSAGGCLTALPGAGRTLGRPPQPPLSALTDTGSSTGCGSSSGSSAVTSPGGRETPKVGRRPHPAAAAAAPSPAPTGRAPAARAPAAAPRWAERAPAAGAAQVAVERTAPGRSETVAQTSQSLLPPTVVSPQSEEGSSSVLLQSGCCQTTPPAGLSAACQTQPDSPDRQQAGCQTEAPGGAAENLSLPPSPHGGATGHRPAPRTGGDGSLSRSDSSGHRSTASGEDLSEGEVLLPAWLRWVGAAGSATTVRSSAVTLAAASRHTIGSHPTEQEVADTTLSEGEVTGDTVPVGTFPSMSTIGPVRSALGPGPSGTTLGPSATTLGPGPSRTTLGPSGSQLSAGQRRSSHLSAGHSQLAVSRGQLAAGHGSLPPSVPSVDSVPAARTASDSRLSAVRAGPGPPSAVRSEVSGRPAARAASSPRLSTVCDRPSARRRRSWAAPAPAPAGADRPPEPGDLSDGEVSGSVRVRHVHIRPVRAGPTFELGEEGGPAPASEGLWSEGEAAEDGGLWADQASLHG